MNNANTFPEFLENLKIENKDRISNRYKRITKVLNIFFYADENDSKHSLQVGSYGRKTAIKGVSDLDMIFEISEDDFNKYNNRKNNGQSDLLQDVRSALLETYPKTVIRGDGQVVVVQFNSYVIEVCPGFSLTDSSYKYPDSNNGGSWKITKPRQEINEISLFNTDCENNLRKLAKMVRAWKNKNGVKIGGLLIDTLCYDFFKENEGLRQTVINDFDDLLLNFFEFLKTRNKHQKYWYAPGSKQKVYKKGNFISKAKKAYKKIELAIEKSDNANVYGIWRSIFGKQFPYPQEVLEKSKNYTEMEQFIEDQFPLDIRYNLKIEGEVSRQGFRDMLLSRIKFITTSKKIKFFIQNTDVTEPFEVRWKVKNKGEIAKKKNMLRGEILMDSGKNTRIENSSFSGEHFVECYIIQKGICVARDRITVPISIN